MQDCGQSCVPVHQAQLGPTYMPENRVVVKIGQVWSLGQLHGQLRCSGPAMHIQPIMVIQACQFRGLNLLGEVRRPVALNQGNFAFHGYLAKPGDILVVTFMGASGHRGQRCYQTSHTAQGKPPLPPPIKELSKVSIASRLKMLKQRAGRPFLKWEEVGIPALEMCKYEALPLQEANVPAFPEGEKDSSHKHSIP